MWNDLFAILQRSLDRLMYNSYILQTDSAIFNYVTQQSTTFRMNINENVARFEFLSRISKELHGCSVQVLQNE